MTRYRMTSSQPLDFPNLEHPDGIGLRLEPGDEIDLDVEPVKVYLDGDEIGSHYPGSPWLVPVDEADDHPAVDAAPLDAAPEPINAEPADVAPPPSTPLPPITAP